MASEHHTLVQIELLTGGVDAVEKMIISQRVGAYSCRRALASLKRAKRIDKDLLKDFESLLRQFKFVGSSGKPGSGETRRYKVQDSGKGTYYVRLPVNAMGAKPGDELEAEFFLGEVRVKPV